MTKRRLQLLVGAIVLLAALSFLLLFLGMDFQIGWLSSTGFVLLGLTTLILLGLAAPGAIFAKMLANRSESVAWYLRFAANTFVGFLTVATLVSLFPSLLTPRTLPILISVAATAGMGAAFAKFPQSNFGRRVLRALVVLVMLGRTWFPNSAAAVSGLIPRIDRFIAWHVNTTRRLSPTPQKMPIPNLEALEHAKLFAADGSPLAWYEVDKDGRIALFAEPAVDPVTGAKLSPITPAIVERLREQLRSHAEKEAAAREAHRLHDLRALVRRKPRVGPTAAVVVQVPDGTLSSGRASSLLASALQGAPSAAGLHVYGDAFQSRFVKGDYFSKVFGGSTRLLRDTGVFEWADVVLLGVLHAKCGDSSIEKDLLKCHLDLQYEIVNGRSLSLEGGSLERTIAGFSRDGAIRDGLASLGEQGAPALDRAIRGS